MTQLQQDKQALRTTLLQRRAQLRAADRQRMDDRIHQQLWQVPALADAAVVFIYLSTAAEVDTRPVMDALQSRGVTLVIPKITPAGMICVEFSGWDDLAPGQLGILTPVSDTPYSGQVDVCITPGLGFSATGARIGYGRGYYDRWFAGHTVEEKIALCYECQLCGEIPVSAHDVYMDRIITEQRGITVTP